MQVFNSMQIYHLKSYNYMFIIIIEYLRLMDFIYLYNMVLMPQ